MTNPDISSGFIRFRNGIYHSNHLVTAIFLKIGDYVICTLTVARKYISKTVTWSRKLECDFCVSVQCVSKVRCEVHFEVYALFPNFGIILTTSQRTLELLVKGDLKSSGQ